MTDQGDVRGGLFRSLLGQTEDDPPRLEPPPPPPGSATTIDLTHAPDQRRLLAAIEGSDPAARMTALRSLLGREVDPSLVVAAAGALKDPEPDVRMAALAVIEQAPRFAPLESLEAATLDRDIRIRARALAALGRTQRASALGTVHERLASEAEEVVIDAGLVALGQLLQTASRPFPPNALVDVAKTVAALPSAARTRHRSELGLIARVIREDDLIHLLRGSDDRVRFGAASLVAERGSGRAAAVLAEMTGDEAAEVRDLAAAVARIPLQESTADSRDAAGFDVDRFGRRASDLARRTQLPDLGDDAKGAPGETTGDRSGRFAAVMGSLSLDLEARRASVQSYLREIDRHELSDLLEEYLEDLSPGKASNVARLLTHFDRLEAVPFLARSMLELDEGPERDAVAEALRSSAETWRLVDVLQNDPSPSRRAKGIQLAGLVDASRVDPLVAGLRDPNTSVRLVAIASSGSVLRSEVAETLMEIIASDTSPKARVAAIARLRDADQTLRVRAAELALRSHVTEARKAAIELLTGNSDQELGLLARGLHDREVEVAEAAIAHLGSLRAPEALAVLWSSLRLVQPAVQESILTAMEAFDREAVVFLGRQALDSSDPGDRVLGLAVLARLETDANERLLMAMEDPSPEVRLEALRNALADPDPSIVAAVGGRLRDPETAVRSLALKVLEAVEDDRTLPFFVDGAKDPAPEVRRAAKDALLRHSSDAVMDLLLKAIEFPTHRRAAADLLVEMGRPAIERLAAALPGTDPDVRRMIGEVLRAGDAEEILIEELDHRDPDRRMRAVSGLGAIGSKEAVPALVERIRDPDAGVRAEVAEVLGSLGDARAIEPLKKAFISDPDMEVVRAIEPALRRLTGDVDR